MGRDGHQPQILCTQFTSRSSTAVEFGGKSMDGSGIFGQEAAAGAPVDTTGESDPKSVDKAEPLGKQATPPSQAAPAAKPAMHPASIVRFTRIKAQ